MNEINILDKNIQDLNKQLAFFTSKESSYCERPIDIKHLITSLTNLGTTIADIDDTSQKRFLIQTIIKSAIWDSENNNVKIILY